MAVTSMNCPFCGHSIELKEGHILDECPECGKGLHQPAYKKPLNVDSTGVFKLTENAESPTIEKKAFTSPHSPDKHAIVHRELKRLGPYEIVRSIGQGGMGYVYEAVDTRLNRRVALKTIETGIDECLIQRFRDEARNSARLRHANIVSVHDVGREGGFDYFIMDLVDGVTLDQWLKNMKPSITDLLKIIEKVARALHYSHQEGVIHRDVKPSNIMIDRNGEPHVMDFGLARNTKDSHNLTLGGTIVGTPAYMSPEQAIGTSDDVGPGVDIWGLGVVMYESLVGKAPFDNGNVYQTIYAVLHDEPEMLRKLRADISIEVELIVLKCLEKQAKRRYRTAEALAEDLKAWLECRAISVRPLSWWQKLAKQFKKSRNISLDEFMLEHQARQKAETERLELQKRMESESRQEWNLVAEENFINPHIESCWEIIAQSWEVKDGELRMRGGRPQILIFKKPPTGDVRIEFSCRQEGDTLSDMSCFMAALSLRNRIKACDTGYIFQFGGQGNTRTFIERAGVRLCEKAESPILRGVSYRICAEKRGSRLSFWVNGILIFEVDDPAPLLGVDHHMLGLYGWEADTWYKEIKIYTLGPPVKADILEMAHRQLEKGSFEASRALFEEVIDSNPDPIRLKQAESGLEIIKNQRARHEKFPVYQERILQCWPQAKLDLTDEGLELNIAMQSIENLSPIEGIHLDKIICFENSISSLEPLRGMPLSKLEVSSNKIADLSPLQGMPLKELAIRRNNIRSLEPLRGMGLQILKCSNNPLQDCEVLRDMPLQKLVCENIGLKNIHFVERMKLESLDFGENQVQDLTPVSKLSLCGLYFDDNQISSLEPLRLMNRLDQLTFNNNQISSLEPLKGKLLSRLECWGNPLTSLEPFVENPPNAFSFYCKTLPNSELKRAIKVWSTNASNVHHARNATILLALNERDIPQLKKLSVEFRGNRYLFVPCYSRWGEARDMCKKVGGDLLVIRSNEEEQFLKTLPFLRGEVWVGAIFRDGKAGWIDGSKIENLKQVVHYSRVDSKISYGFWQRDQIVFSDEGNSYKQFMIQWS